MTPMGKVLRTVYFVAGLALIGSIGYCAYGYGSAETRIRGLCAQFKQGMPISELRNFAMEHGLRPPTSDSGVSFLVEGRTFGRFGCKVTLEGGVVRTSEYHFAD